MSYRTTVKLQHNYHPTAAFTRRDALIQRLQLGFGGAGRLVSIGDQLEQVAVAYELGENGFDSHLSVVESVEWAASQLFVQAIEAEVVRLVQVGIYTGVAGGAAAFGITAKAHPVVTVIATLAAAYGGYKLGQAMPQELVILRATRHPYYGWTWIEVQPPQLRGSQATA